MAERSRKINLCVVVDPEYGELLEQVAARLPVWIVDTPANRRFFGPIWCKRPPEQSISLSAEGSITSYEVADPRDRELNLLEVLPDIEEHYGQSDKEYETLRADPSHRYAHLSNGFGIDVIGPTISDFLESRLSDFGFGEVVPTASGFQAWIIRKHLAPVH